ncbi:MAG: diacylglycerol kinase family protein [Actinomycetaceae bacterium]|nr:diacylglycerol kinase family protein [Actinomycetaceae bacterium]
MEAFVLEPNTVDLVHFIYNPVSGSHENTAKANTYVETLKILFPQAQIIVLATEAVGHATELAKTLVKQVNQTKSAINAVLVVSGGDGTVSETANGLIGSQIPLLVLPGGTGNDFTRSLYQKEPGENDRRTVDRVLAEFVASAAEGFKVFEVDAIKLDAASVQSVDGENYTSFSRYGLNVLSVGFDSVIGATAQRIHRKTPWVGAMSYLLAAIRHLTNIPRFSMDLHASRADRSAVEFSGSYSICVMSNARFYGGGFQPNPRGSLTDGKIDILLAKELNRRDVLALIGKFRAGKEIPSQYAQTFQSTALTLKASTESSLIFNVDGEVFSAQEMQVKVHPAALRVIVPAISERNPAFENN